VVIPLALDHFLLDQSETYQARLEEVRRWDNLALVQLDSRRRLWRPCNLMVSSQAIEIVREDEGRIRPDCVASKAERQAVREKVGYTLNSVRSLGMRSMRTEQ